MLLLADLALGKGKGSRLPLCKWGSGGECSSPSLSLSVGGLCVGGLYDVLTGNLELA